MFAVLRELIAGKHREKKAPVSPRPNQVDLCFLHASPQIFLDYDENNKKAYHQLIELDNAKEAKVIKQALEDSG